MLVDILKSTNDEEVRSLSEFLRSKGYAVYVDQYPPVERINERGERNPFIHRVRVRSDQVSGAREILDKLKTNRWVKMPHASSRNWLQKIL